MQTVTVNDTTIAYEDLRPDSAAQAKGTIVFGHSLFFTSAMFRQLTELLTADGYRCVVYDHRGQGQSSPATDSTPDELSLVNLAADAAALIEKLEIVGCDYVGNSLGGMVGLLLAARWPDLVRSVVALGSSAEQEHQEFAPFVVRLGSRGPEAMIDELMYIMFGDDSLADADSEMIKQWRQYMSELPREIAEVALPVIERPRLAGELRLHSGRVPVLAIAGDQDHAYPPPISADNIANATGGHSAIIAGAGHSVALERPNEVFGLIRAHLERLAA